VNSVIKRLSGPRAGPARQGQRGVVLMIALIVLVAMTLAGIAMFRQVGTGIIVAGNLAFKDNATSVADLGIEAARAWLMTKGAGDLQVDMPGPSDAPTAQTNGHYFYSDWRANFNPATYPWDSNNASTLVTADDGTGNEVRFVVHRLCAVAGVSINATNQKCVQFGTTGGGMSHGRVSYGIMRLSSTVQPYFRITVRVLGPRNTQSYVQAMMY
jgi:type IV pilus assembly protein PilX